MLWGLERPFSLAVLLSNTYLPVIRPAGVQMLDVDALGEGARADLGHLASVPHLCQLRITRCFFWGPSIASLAGQLTWLDLSHCPQASAGLLEGVGKLHRLQVLNLTDCKGLTDVLLLSLSGLDQLEHLSLSSCPGLDVSRPPPPPPPPNRPWGPPGGLPPSLLPLTHSDLPFSHSNSLQSMPSLTGVDQLEHLSPSSCPRLDMSIAPPPPPPPGVRWASSTLGHIHFNVPFMYSKAFKRVLCCGMVHICLTDFNVLLLSVRGVDQLEHLSLRSCPGLVLV